MVFADEVTDKQWRGGETKIPGGSNNHSMKEKTSRGVTIQIGKGGGKTRSQKGKAKKSTDRTVHRGRGTGILK